MTLQVYVVLSQTKVHSLKSAVMGRRDFKAVFSEIHIKNKMYLYGWWHTLCAFFFFPNQYNSGGGAGKALTCQVRPVDQAGNGILLQISDGLIHQLRKFSHLFQGKIVGPTIVGSFALNTLMMERCCDIHRQHDLSNRQSSQPCAQGDDLWEKLLFHSWEQGDTGMRQSSGHILRTACDLLVSVRT